VLGVSLQQGGDGRRQPRIGSFEGRKPGATLIRRKIETRLQEREDFLEIAGREILHDRAQEAG
jgi:hypothetical protein